MMMMMIKIIIITNIIIMNAKRLVEIPIHGYLPEEYLLDNIPTYSFNETSRIRRIRKI